MSLLSASKLSIERGGRRLLRGLDFDLESGRIVVVLGPNGAGKSSLLLALAGLLQVSGGEMCLNGRSLATCKRTDLAALIAWQGEVSTAEFGLTVEQRLLLAMHSGLNAQAGEARRRSACENMNLLPLRHRPLGELSSGERQRVELAALLVRDCPVWLLDEPCAHLDIHHQVSWLHNLRRQAASGKAIVAVLHDVQQTVAVADDVILIYGDGRARCGRAKDLLTPDILGELLQTGMRQLDGGVLMPDYRGDR